MSTDLTSEFIHFKLVIRLSNGKRPYRYPPFLQSLPALVVPGLLVEIHSCQCEAVQKFQKLRFSCSFSCGPDT